MSPHDDAGPDEGARPNRPTDPSLVVALDELYGDRQERDERNVGASRPSRKRRKVRKKGQRTSSRDRLAWPIAGVAALGASLSGASPVGSTAADVAWTAAFAALVTMATARARRWTWFWLIATTAVLTGLGGWTALPLVAALVLALWSAQTTERDRLAGAAVGALVVQAMLRADPVGFHGLPSLVAAAITLPVLVSAYRSSPRRLRRRQVRSALALAVLVALAGIGALMAGLSAQAPIDDAVTNARRGSSLLQEGELSEAAARFEASSAAFRDASNAVGAPTSWPARFVPGMAQQVDAVDELAGVGADIADTAALVAVEAPYQRLKTSAGQIDLVSLERMRAPLARADRALRTGEERAGAIDNPWLVAPIATELDDLRAELSDRADEISLASEGVALAPGLLGATGDRQYLLLFTSPAETRELGGFVGAYGVLEARAGKLDLIESGSIGDLNRLVPEGGLDLDVAPAYEARYAAYNPARFFQNLTLVPDLPTVAAASRDAYEQVRGRKVDGVMVIDPAGLASLLELTGPVRLDGPPGRIGPDDVEQYLLRTQYESFEGANADRRDALVDVADATFDQLTSMDLPGPARLGRVLGPAVDGEHLAFFPFLQAEQDLFSRLGTLDPFTTSADSDHLSVRTTNNGPNKIDSFLRRTVDAKVLVDPSSGEVRSTVTVVLTNEAPASGLPDYVIGNSGGSPPGTNEMTLAVYSKLGLTDLTIDGAQANAGPSRAFDGNAYDVRVDVPPGGTRTVVFELAGTPPSTRPYRLAVDPQPLARPDRFTLDVSGVDVWEVTELVGVDAEGVTIEDNTLTSEALTSDLQLEAVPSRR